MTIQKIFSSRRPNIFGNAYVGEAGRPFFDENEKLLRVSDGHTPGGTVMVPNLLDGQANLNVFNVTVQGNTTTVNNITSNNQTTLTGVLTVTGNAAFNGNTSITGNALFTGNTDFVGPVRIFGTIYQIGDRITTGSSTFTGNSSFTGNSVFTGNTTFVGPIFSTGTRISQGDSIFNGNVTTNGNLITVGNTYFNGYILFNGQTIHQGNLTTSGNLIVNGTSYFTGDVTEVGNLLVTGNTINNGTATFNGTTIRNGSTISNGTTTFNGNVTTNGNLLIIGTTTQVGNLVITGTAINNGPSIFNGNTVINGVSTNNGPSSFNGNITTNGNSIQAGTATFIVSTNNMNTGAVEITGNAQGLSQPPALPGVMLHVTGQDNGTTPGRSYFDAVGQYSIIVGRKFNGTVANPTQVLAGEEVFRLAGTGYPTGGWPTTGVAQIRYIADENQTQTNRGGHLDFLTVPIGSNVVTQVMSVSATTGVTVLGNIAVGNVAITNNETIGGNVTVTGNITAGNVTATTHYGNVIGTNITLSGNITAGNIAVSSSGTLSTPRVIINDGGLRTVTGGTTLTVDFNSDSRILWYVPAGDTTITLSNYTAGAEVAVMVRMGGTGRNIALGVAGVNNTTTGATGSTTLTGHGPGALYGANQAVALVYTCFDTTQANCYVRASYV